MQTGYGPALLLGLLIGGAILLDDIITPERKGHPPRVAMFHHGEGLESAKNLAPEGDHNVGLSRARMVSSRKFTRKST